MTVATRRETDLKKEKNKIKETF